MREPGAGPRAELAARLQALRGQAADLTDETVARRATMVLSRERGTSKVDARRLGEWLSGAAVPHRFEALAAVVTVLHEHTRLRGRSRSGASPDLAGWRALWSAARAAAPAQPPPEPRPEPSFAPQGGSAAARPGRLLVGRPPLLADCFAERSALATVLHHAGPDARPGATVLLLGSGGAGKTQLAAAVADRVLRTAGALVVWVPATSRDAVLSAYAAALAVLADDSDVPLVGADVAPRADAFLAWLRTTSRQWLVVLDDVDDPADVDGLWPVGAGSVLVTSRRREAGLVRSDRVVVDVAELDADEATVYLCRRLEAAGATGLAAADAADGAAALAAAVGYLPLALAQAAAVVIDAGTTCAQYARWLEDSRVPLDDVLPGHGADEYPWSVAGTVRLAVGRADRLADGLAGPALELAACFAAEPVPDEVWRSGAALRWLALRSGRDTVDVRAGHAALRALHRLSLVTHDLAGPGTVRVHALVQRVARDGVPPALRAAAAHAAADALVEVWPQGEDATQTGTALRRHALAVLAHLGDGIGADGVHPLVWRHGSALGAAGLHTAARDRFREVATTGAARWGEDHPDVARAQHGWARWEAAAGDPDGAVTALESVTADLGRLLGADDPSTLAARHDLGVARSQRGDFAGAAAALAAVLADRERVLGRWHPDTLLTLAEHASTALETRAAAEQVDRLTAVLPAAAAALGAGHHVVLRLRAETESLRCNAGDVVGGTAGMTRVLADLVRTVGPDHPDALVLRNNLAVQLSLAGRADEAAPLYAGLLRSQQRILGPTHPNTLLTRINVAFNRDLLGDLAAALGEYDALVADIGRALSPDHEVTRRVRMNRATALGRSGDAAGAVRELATLLPDYERVAGPDAEDTLLTRVYLGQWRTAAGDDAVADLAATEADCLRALGPDDWVTWTARLRLGEARALAGDPAGPPAVEDAVRRFTARFGADDRRTRTAAAVLDAVAGAGAARP